MPDNNVFWIGLAAAALHVWRGGVTLPYVERMIHTVVSAGLGYASARGDIFGDFNQVLVAITVTAVGPFALDTLTGIVKDRDSILAMIKARFFK